MLYGTGAAQAAKPEAPKPIPPTNPTTTTTAHDVTLVTGDRLTVHSDGRVSIAPNPDRKGIKFMSYEDKGGRYVIPSDAIPLITAGNIDGQLFNVSKLIEFGYTTKRGDLPLIVTAGKSAKASATGATVTRELTAIKGLAVQSKHATATTFWENLKANGSKVWLDALYKPTLDQSVPHVGAPSAWAAGFDGTGTKVAVVDSGIDTTHPDLAGKVLASANFTTEPDARDYLGHGTHVAATVGGTGSSTLGAHAGVAPGAWLLNSKVCIADNTCSQSAIIAGMQWAVDQGADVVNLSLGGGDTPGIDPLEQAINDLTASHGALFVVAAGNSNGQAGPRSVSSPSTADSALSVAAMDLSDNVAPFSNRGPRVGDAALKPDIAAPGVAITAARSTTSPGSGNHIDLSGTSMATPHVAGAAAILAQRHPTWTPAQLKAGVMNSSVPNPAHGVFTQGAGRLNVARTFAQTVTSSPASVSFGRQQWPHGDDPVLTQTITFRNDGTSGIGLSLSVDARDANGNPAPAGMFSISTNFVSMLPGATASITLTANTTVSSPDGFYGGWVTGIGSGGATATSTPFGVDKGEEGYELTLTHINRAGVATPAFGTIILKSDLSFGMGVGGVTGPLTTFLTPGTYLVSAMVFDGPDISVLMVPRLEMTQNRNITIDARTAQPVNITVPDPTAAHFFTDIGGQLSINNINASVFNIVRAGENAYTAQVFTPSPAQDFTGKIVRTFAVPGANNDFRNSPKVWHIGRYFNQSFPTGHTRAVTPSELHTVTASHTRHAAGSTGFKGAFSQPPTGSFNSAAQSTLPTALPFTRTEYYDTTGIKWGPTFDEIVESSNATIVGLTAPFTQLNGGSSSTQSWNKPVYGPSFAGPLGSALWVVRSGDIMRFVLPMFSDPDGHAGIQTGTGVPLNGQFTLRQGSTVIGSFPFTSNNLIQLPVSPGWLPYTVEAFVERGAPVELSTRVSSTWAFTSDSVDPNSILRLAMWSVNFKPTLDAQNQAPKNTSFQIPLTATAQQDSPASSVRTLNVDWSIDDGATWTAATVTTVGGNRFVTIPHPNTTGFISLRAYVDDWANNSANQTIIRAYKIG